MVLEPTGTFDETGEQLTFSLHATRRYGAGHTTRPRCRHFFIANPMSKKIVGIFLGVHAIDVLGMAR